MSLFLLLSGTTRVSAQLTPGEVTPGKTIVLKSVSNLKNHYFMTTGTRSVVYNPDACRYTVEAVTYNGATQKDATHPYFVLKNGSNYLKSGGSFTTTTNVDEAAVFYAQEITGNKSSGQTISDITLGDCLPETELGMLTRFVDVKTNNYVNCGDADLKWASGKGGYSAFYVYETTDVDGIIAAHIYEDTQFNAGWTETGVAGTSPETVTDVTAEGAKSYWIRNAADNTKYLSSTTAATETLSEFGRFMFVAVTGKSHVYKIYNVDTQKYLKWKEKTAEADKTEWVDDSENDESLYWWIRRDEGATTDANAGQVDVLPYGEFKQSWNWYNGASATNTMGLYQYTDANSKWKLVEYSDAKTITIHHRYNSEVDFLTETKNVRVGTIYDLTANMHIAGLTSSTYESYTITVDTPNDVIINYTLSGMPFETSTVTDGAFADDATHWYTMQLKAKYLAYEETTNALKNKDNTALPDMLSSRYLFAFVGDPINGYKVYNRATGATKVMGGTVTDAAKVTMQAETAEDTECFILEKYNISGGSQYVFRKAGSTNGYLNEHRGNGYCAYWTDGTSAPTNDGSAFIFAEVSADDLENLPLNDAKESLSQIISRANQYTGSGDNLRIGTRFNLYQSETIKQPSDLQAYVTTAQAALDATDATVESLTAATTTLTDILKGLKLNMPDAKTFLRVRATNNNKGSMPYLQSDNSTVEGKTTRAAFSGTKDGNSIFYFDGSKLVAYSTGYYLKANDNMPGYATAAADNAGAPITFKDAPNGTVGAYGITINDTKDRYMHVSESDGNYYADAGNINGTATEAGYNYWLEEVMELPVKISNGKKLATFWSPVDVTVPGTVAVDVYTVTVAAEQNAVVLEKQESGTKLPAGTGMLLHGDAGTYYFAIENTATGSRVGALTGQAYMGTYTYDESSSMVYTLQTLTNGKMGFKKYSGSVIPAFKGYLDLAGTGVEVNALSLIFADDATGVENIEAAGTEKAAAIYDLSGRRVSSPKKGIYIVNGTKVLIK